MSSVELPRAKDVSAAAGPYVAKSFFRSLLSFLAVDVVVMLCFNGAAWQWAVLTGVEAVFLLLHLWRTNVQVRRVLQPMSSLTEAAERVKTSALDANDLRRLARKLERVEAPTMAERVAITGSGKELGILAEAINAMLARIDRSYQAQVRFTSNVSHELRTPISVIQGYANMLDRWGKNDPEIRQEAIDAIRTSAQELNALVEQFLFLTRSDSGTQRVDLEPVDLTALVTAVAKQTDVVDDTHRIVSEVEAGVTGVADAAKIKECLRILCDNAVKYTPEGGSVTIALRVEAGFAHISVTDTGRGISEADLPHVFERFFRSDESRSRATGGTGLGLSIAAWIAACHHGRIDVQSRLGLGSKFTLVFPLTPPEETPEEG